MPRRIVLAMFLSLCTGTELRAQGVGASITAPEVVATGYAQTRLRPDRGSVVLAVVTYGRSAAQAGQLNSERIAPLLAAMRRIGFVDSAFSTTGYSVDENEEYDAKTGNSRPNGFVARNAVRVRLPTLDRLSAVIDTALKAGATEVGEIAFESSRTEEGRRTAIASAVRAARGDAEAAAAAMGGRLGTIIEITVDPPDDIRYAYGLNLSAVQINGLYGAAAAAPTQIHLTDITVSVRVRIRAQLID